MSVYDPIMLSSSWMGMGYAVSNSLFNPQHHTLKKNHYVINLSPPGQIE